MNYNYLTNKGYSTEEIESFRDYLEEIYPNDIKVAGISFDAFNVLYNCDPIACSVLLSDYLSWIEEE